MTENLQDELYPLENKQAKKVLNFVLTLKWKLEGKKMLKNLFQSTWKTESKSHNFWIICDDNKLNYSSNPKNIFQFGKKIKNKNLYIKDTTFKVLLLNFLAKFLKERKYLMNNLTYTRQTYFRWDHKIYKISNK